jgi:glucosidase (fragment)
MDREIKSGDIELTKTEIRDILALNAKYEKFILVLNVGGVIDLSEVKEVKTILLMSQLGSATGDALADVLFGKSYPSGKLTTTWASIKNYPSTEGFGDLNDTYYNEGVYVGYRYFDTVNLEPSYPFGFGLGYSQFEIENTKVEVSELEIKVEVTVKNIGSFAGKETVQLYVSAPKGKLDKPYQELKGYAKTKELKPNESAVVKILVLPENLSSFDTENLAYVLEEGTYWLRVGFSSRDTKVIAGVVLDKSVEIEKVKAVCTDETLIDVVPEFIGLENDDNGKSGTPIFYLDSNKFTTKIYKYSEIQKELNTDKKVYWKSVVDKTATLSGTEIVGNASAKVAGGAGETTHFLKSLGVPSIVIADGPAGLRLAKEYYLMENGEVREKNSDQNLEKFENNSVYYQYCTAIPIGTALAQSWNDKLVSEIGDIVGYEMELFGVQLWLAPAINIHRSPLCGRNFEYYSEDPFLSGHIGSAIIKGVQKHSGCGTTIKHYACNNQETNRHTSNSVVSQRALREIYLKPFEICVKEAQPKAIMSSYNLINKEHSCNSKDIQTHILHDEWGFEGFVMTDWFVTSDMMSNENSKYKCASAAGNVKAGNDLTMPGTKEDLEDILSAIDNLGHKYPLSRAELQFAAKNVLKKVLEL